MVKDAVNRFKLITRLIVLGVFFLWFYAGFKLLNSDKIMDLHVRLFDILSSTLIWILVLYLIRRTLENPDVIGKLIDKLPAK